MVEMRLRPFSLRTKLIVSSLILILIPIFGVGIYSYNAFESVLSKQTFATASDRLHQVNINIEREMRAMMNASNSVVLDDRIHAVLIHPPNTERQTIDSVDQVDKKVLEISTAIITDPVFITVMDNFGNLYTNWFQSEGAYERIRAADFYRKAQQLNGYMSWTLNHPNYVSDKSENLVTLAMVIKEKTSSRNIGTLIISEPVSHYADILRATNLPYRNFGFMMDADGHILAEDPQWVNSVYPSILRDMQMRRSSYTAEANGEQVDVATDFIPLSDWLVVQAVHHKDVFKPIQQIRDVAVSLLLICVAIFIAILIIQSNMFTSSIRKLQGTMRKVEEGNLDVAVDIRSLDEVGWLGKSFNRMVRRLGHYIEREIELERSKENAKLEALQAQINPHFLHNTINTIKWMSIMAGTKPITEMLLSLGHLLNMSIHRGQEAITVREELDNVRYFMTIQKYRFGDTIEITEDVDPETLDAYVPKLSLQPLVENVYQHGLFINGGKMIIRTRIVQDEIVLEVSDNGVGLTEARIKELEGHLSGMDRDGLFSGIGLKNVHRRIQIMFGPTYGLRIEQGEGDLNTSISIHFPYRRDLHELASGRDR
ncbi:sensor histidine kinase [Paenibacillus thalictri]|uniref:Sensor histidine kinase n=1 Tax=Paenibacillus thalictri TaxID=2527873 RepID=A0A4Q9DG54_9BACL|nr:sensor histidine kinase [Paenibacillus thalictri]